ncbi:alkene reductase [Puniceibacterium sp. IMCC21224]|uniref:alkene reductase n=1 Tax=Puniceibacterium sp. IMCC21224 TaxID=1618204 RepID=UPI00064DF379|nr:alkene reductase [Puniceibacterium sp. IMCC21224]KMK66565.1 NADH:flavin oxidoreductase [Puniceibacterium sp. IMCC21224]
MTEQSLFSAFTAGDIALKNRVVMAPLTRNRARPEDDTPHGLHVDYYTQRAGAGLIITEATQISPEGKGYAWTPGIYSDVQVAGWKKVTESVHKAGGRIVLQLWHVGRVSHTSLQEGGKAPVAPSAIGAGAKTFDGEKMLETSEPRALELDEIPRIIEDFRKAAVNARRAGFDGVELHAANGYLLDQFMKDGANKRDDAYGGSLDNRTRLTFEALDAVLQEWEPGRVGIRISPFSNANNITESDPAALALHVVDRLAGYDLAYIHLIEGQTGGKREWPESVDMDDLKARSGTPWMVNNGYDRAMALAAVADDHADLVAFGVPFIANPDLVARLKLDAPLNQADSSTFYGGGAKGYTDYPTLDEAQKKAG